MNNCERKLIQFHLIMATPNKYQMINVPDYSSFRRGPFSRAKLKRARWYRFRLLDAMDQKANAASEMKRDSPELLQLRLEMDHLESQRVLYQQFTEQVFMAQFDPVLVALLLFFNYPHPINVDDLADVYQEYYQRFLSDEDMSKITDHPCIEKKINELAVEFGSQYADYYQLSNLQKFLQLFSDDKVYELICEKVNAVMEHFPHGVPESEEVKLFRCGVGISLESLKHELQVKISKLFSLYTLENGNTWIYMSWMNEPDPSTKKVQVLNLREKLVAILCCGSSTLPQLKQQFVQRFGADLQFTSAYTQQILREMVKWKRFQSNQIFVLRQKYVVYSGISARMIELKERLITQKDRLEQESPATRLKIFDKWYRELTGQMQLIQDYKDEFEEDWWSTVEEWKRFLRKRRHLLKRQLLMK